MTKATAKKCGTCIYPIFYSRCNCCLDPRNRKIGAFVFPGTDCFTGGYIENRQGELKKHLNVERAKEVLRNGNAARRF